MAADAPHRLGALVQIQLIEIFEEKIRILLITSSILSFIVAIFLREAVAWNLLLAWLVIIRYLLATGPGGKKWASAATRV